MIQRDFSGPLLKVERADHHINELERLLGRYVAENRKRFSPKHQERAFKQGRTVRFAEPERHTPTVLGDALHNLRASLDHAYCILIEANGHVTTDFSRFPFGGNWASIKGSIDGHIKAGNGPSEAVRDHIGTEVEPFPGGKYNLWDLHRLDITDKHQRILPMRTHTSVGSMQITDPVSGRIMAEMKDCTFSGNTALADGAVAILQDDVKNAFDVTFDKGQPLAGQPILPTLERMRAATEDALNGLSKFL